MVGASGDQFSNSSPHRTYFTWITEALRQSMHFSPPMRMASHGRTSPSRVLKHRPVRGTIRSSFLRITTRAFIWLVISASTDIFCQNQHYMASESTETWPNYCPDPADAIAASLAKSFISLWRQMQRVASMYLLQLLLFKQEMLFVSFAYCESLLQL